jgi:hypothetical protein
MSWNKEAKPGDKVTCVKGSYWSECAGVNAHHLTNVRMPKPGETYTISRVDVIKGIEFFTLEGFDRYDHFCWIGFRPKAAAKIKEAA